MHHDLKLRPGLMPPGAFISGGASLSLRRLCVQAGCDDIAAEGANRCPEHLTEQMARMRASRARAKAGAASWAHLYSGRDWRMAAGRFLEAHPLCCDCASVGLVVPATDVDHIAPHRGDRRLFWLRENWQALCHGCHSRKTAREVLAGRRASHGAERGG